MMGHKNFSLSPAGSTDLFDGSMVLYVLSHANCCLAHNNIFYDMLIEKNQIPGFKNTIFPSSSDGLRVTIDIPSVIPDPDQQGIDVSPGYATLIAIAGKEVIRLPWPYGSCTDTDYELKLLRESVSKLHGYKRTNFAEDGHSAYSQQQCQSACLQRLILKECKCLDLKSRLPFPDIEGKLLCGTLGEAGMDMLLNGDKYNTGNCHYELIDDKCNFLHKMINDLACVKKVTDMFNEEKVSGDSECNCPAACHSYEYIMTVSQSKWPASGFETDAAYMKFVEDEKQKWVSDYDAIADPMEEWMLRRYSEEGAKARIKEAFRKRRFVQCYLKFR